NLALLKQLSEAPGVPGREERVREILRKEFDALFDDVSVDPLGSLIGRKRAASGDAKKVLLACHIDEIGFYVRHVDDKGFVRVHNVGGFDTRNLLARRVMIQSSGGGDLPGLLNPAGRPLHIAKDEEKKKVPEINDFFVDLCLPADEVKQKVRVGDPVTLVQAFAEVGQCVTGKCLDNRVAAFVAVEALRKAKTLKYDVTLAATVQEEVGLRGAGPAAYSAEPDIAIAVDTTLCVDTPGVPEDERITRQHDGVALTIMDSSLIADRALVDDFERVAKAREIPCQFSILTRGGTDAGAMQRIRGGYRAMTLSVPTRYIHTVTESVSKKDLQSAIDLLAAWLET
ncbi:MAG TPA: M20/M25/M40 family metallo-hydrolase, partial [Tepidisphaeraceae bacterium]|nr:M20/M25/M40 family metallo-hydrolase [Tepidisphaeraceae bacterium]